jgi:biotin transporter BioY
MFFLTRREQALVAFVLTAFLIGLGAHHWRTQRGLEALAVVEGGK